MNLIYEIIHSYQILLMQMVVLVLFYIKEYQDLVCIQIPFCLKFGIFKDLLMTVLKTCWRVLI